ncbi:MAG: elongation factor G [Planctomycetes bacterium]|nr:elongation factor G [Planctomycetota bacterium]
MADPNLIHSLAFTGHGGCGKTTLMESLLFKAGAINRRGTVLDGTSVGLVDPEEKARKITLNCNLFHASWKNHQLQFLDAPGYTDFVGGAIEALAAADIALVCVSAQAGIEVNTRKAWNLATDRKIPRAIAITKMEMENADFGKVLAAVQETFTPSAIPIYLPNASGSSFSGLVSVLDPPAGNEEAQALREKLMEAVVESDDALLERYLAEEKISEEEMAKAFTQAILAGKVVPVIPCSGLKDIGTEELLNAVITAFPSAAGRVVKGKGPGSEELTREPSADGPFSAQVFRLVSDKFVGKLTFFRVLSGIYAPDKPIYNARTQARSKVGGLYRIQGGQQEAVDQVGPGDIAAISKVDEIAVSDTLSDERSPILFDPISFPTPMVSLAVEPKARGDEQKISRVLGILAQEDPTFKTSRHPQTHEMIISGVGTLHLDVMINRMKSRFDLQVVTREPQIPYLETITANSEAHYRHKKQTGGRGQYGEVYLRMYPNERGKGFEFIDAIKGGTIPNQFIPAIEKGIEESMERSCYAGFPAVDLKVEVYFGSYHDVDSDEISFKIASREAYKQGFMAAKPVLLEPIVNLEISIPGRFMGDITSDLNRRRGRITGMDSLGDIQIIRATVPLAEITNYSTELRSITGGEGDFAIEPSHSDVVPPHLASQIVARYSKKGEEKS